MEVAGTGKKIKILSTKKYIIIMFRTPKGDVTEKTVRVYTRHNTYNT
jgi:hypothetical protein